MKKNYGSIANKRPWDTLSKQIMGDEAQYGRRLLPIY